MNSRKTPPTASDHAVVIRCPHCGDECKINASRRVGEGEDHEGRLIGTHCFEAWGECPRHGWISPRLDIRPWSDELPLDEPLIEEHEQQAISGLQAAMWG